MLFKYAVLFVSGVTLCLVIMAAAGQTSDEDRQAVRADQQALDKNYLQLRHDQLSGNAAGVEIDQDNIATAEQDFQADIERTIADDQQNLAMDQQALDKLDEKLQRDTKQNPATVTADQEDISAARQRLQADSEQTIADDGLEVRRDRQALDNENWLLQQDLKGPGYAMGTPDAVQAEKQNVGQAQAVLQEAQLKLQLDRNTQTQP